MNYAHNLSPFHFMNNMQAVPNICQLMILMGLSLMSSYMFILKNKIFTYIMLMIFLFNLSSMLPYFWSITSYFWSNLLLVLILWMSYISFMMYSDLKNFLSMNLPFNTPKMLWMFLVALEVISQLMRPLTLSLRLACNLMTGHVLMSLVLNKYILMSLILIMIILFEIMIGFIQAIVFSMLLEMYKMEVY